MTMHDNKTTARTFAAAFAASVSETLRRALGSDWPLEVLDSPNVPTRKAQPVQFRLKVDGALRGECFVEFYEPQVAELTAKMGGDAEHKAAEQATKLAGVLSSSTAALAAALAPEHGALSFAVECVSGLAFGGMFVVPLSAAADPLAAPVLLYFDGPLMSAFESRSAFEAPRGAFNPGNLKLVMDVELNVSLRFGQRQLPLREVLELSSGSVVELDRMVDEPVELLLDGKVVARGEAVIVDGNYGLRVTEIPQAIESHFVRQ